MQGQVRRRVTTGAVSFTPGQCGWLLVCACEGPGRRTCVLVLPLASQLHSLVAKVAVCAHSWSDPASSNQLLGTCLKNGAMARLQACAGLCGRVAEHRELECCCCLSCRVRQGA